MLLFLISDILTLMKLYSLNSEIFIRKKELNTIGNFPKEKFVHAYTDGSSHKTITNGGSGGLLTTPDSIPHQANSVREI